MIGQTIKRYRFFLILLAINVAVGLALPEIGLSSLAIAKSNIGEMLGVLPPIFILLGLLDVWIEKETMMRYLGKGSGIRGVMMAVALGAAAAGPLYAAFPVATVMLKKRASLFNTMVFIGTWSTAKIPLLTFEVSSLGFAFAGTRLVLSSIGIIGMAWLVCRGVDETEGV